MGMGVGAAMTGLRPIVEGMNMGFLLLAFNQISNNCGMLHYTSGGQYKTPLVIRGPGGVGRQLGAEHSQRLESYFQSIPGVQLVAVSTTANAKALLKSAIRSDNPIIFFEHVLLYNIKGEPHEGDYCQPLEKAELVREGRDVSIFTYSRMRYVVMQAVAELEKKGYNPEVCVVLLWFCLSVSCSVCPAAKCSRCVAKRSRHAVSELCDTHDGASGSGQSRPSRAHAKHTDAHYVHTQYTR